MFTPIIMVADENDDAFIIKGPEVLKKITGGHFLSAAISPDGRELCYLTAYEKDGREGDLFQVSIDGTTVSENRRMDTNVTYSGGVYLGNHFIYFKNGDDYSSIADMYMDGKMIDSGVLTWGVHAVGDAGAFTYPVNSKDYWNDNGYYTCDTLMLYQDGSARKIADNVIDWIDYGEKIVYLWIKNLDATEGTLHLYDTVSGMDTTVDTGVKGFVRPKTDRDRDSEIDLRSRIGDHYP